MVEQRIEKNLFMDYQNMLYDVEEIQLQTRSRGNPIIIPHRPVGLMLGFAVQLGAVALVNEAVVVVVGPYSIKSTFLNQIPCKIPSPQQESFPQFVTENYDVQYLPISPPQFPHGQ